MSFIFVGFTWRDLAKCRSFYCLEKSLEILLYIFAFVFRGRKDMRINNDIIFLQWKQSAKVNLHPVNVCFY